TEWWKKFNTRQKTLLISITAVIIVALVILAVVMTRTTWVDLYDASSYSEASEVKDLLDSDGSIKYKVVDTTHFEVDANDESAANMLLGSNDYVANGYNPVKLSDYLSSGFSTTQADQTKYYKEYYEDKLAVDIASLDAVNSAVVALDIPDDDGTLVSRMQESYASVTLSLANGSMTENQAYSIARFVATALGNSSTDNITLIDQSTATILYSGADQDSDSVLISTQQDTKDREAATVKSEIKSALVESGLFSTVEVGLKLDMSFDNVEDTVHTYWHNDDMDTGEISSASVYDASGDDGTGGIAGTYSNTDDTSYYTSDGEGAWSVSDSSYEYKINEEITQTTNNGGTINYDNCSAAVVAVRDVIYDEDTVRASGALDEMTWDEYKAANGDNVRVEDVDDYVTMVANIVGCDEDAVSFMLIEEPIFVDSETGGISFTDILQILLAVLIFVLLGYVVFRSTRKKKEEEEMEPELSVEALLESTAETEGLEDIAVEEKSETRQMIEKFVDENPDAAALLLRNWLNEDWE
ncbi:MAG: flagellar biosynthesis protein, partial [Clostridiales bacterium]|nr:flagellar biosynthesis protein [Clostridiales bacterium]